jgi:hypothetical protein
MMTREEAIEVYNGLINAKIREAFEFFVPELRESEDERIRKAIIEFIKQGSINGSLRSCLGISEEQMIAYLEKQKEQKEQMMKEAVEGKIIFLLNGDVAVNIGDTDEYKLGQKVRIIIVKEEENGKSY